MYTLQEFTPTFKKRDRILSPSKVVTFPYVSEPNIYKMQMMNGKKICARALHVFLHIFVPKSYVIPPVILAFMEMSKCM